MYDKDSARENYLWQRGHQSLVVLVVNDFLHCKMFTRCKITKKIRDKWSNIDFFSYFCTELENKDNYDEEKKAEAEAKRPCRRLGHIAARSPEL
jgi:hypothetical protein